MDHQLQDLHKIQGVSLHWPELHLRHPVVSYLGSALCTSVLLEHLGHCALHQVLPVYFSVYDVSCLNMHGVLVKITPQGSDGDNPGGERGFT